MNINDMYSTLFKFLVFAMFKILPRWYLLAGGGTELEDHKKLGNF